MKINGEIRYITSGAQADMGFTLPASIGAAVAGEVLRSVIGITGDGSFQMNIQELQTIVNYKLPIKIFILNNGGYLSIRNTMDKFFESRYFGTDAASGLALPDSQKIAKAYDIPYYSIRNMDDINNFKTYIHIIKGRNEMVNTICDKLNTTIEKGCNIQLFEYHQNEMVCISDNSIIIKNELYTPYNPYHFFKIIKSNLVPKSTSGFTS